MHRGSLQFAGMMTALAIGITMLASAMLAGRAIAQAPPAHEPIKQIQLTEKHIQAFIAVQKDMAPLVQKAQALPPGKQDAGLEGEFEQVAKKHGFASYAELGDIGANIMLIMDGLDPSTGNFTDPITAIKKEIEEISADKQMPEKERKEAVAERQEALKSFEPIKFAGNVELIKKWREKIEAALQ